MTTLRNRCIGCSRIFTCLCIRCGGAVASIVSVFAQLRRSGFNIDFETLFESILQAVTGLWQAKAKVVAQHFCCSPIMTKSSKFPKKDLALHSNSLHS